jgi:dUTPase
MLIQKVEHPEIIEVEELSDSSRGAGGFGSTGK